MTSLQDTTGPPIPRRPNPPSRVPEPSNIIANRTTMSRTNRQINDSLPLLGGNLPHPSPSSSYPHPSPPIDDTQSLSFQQHFAIAHEPPRAPWHQDHYTNPFNQWTLATTSQRLQPLRGMLERLSLYDQPRELCCDSQPAYEPLASRAMLPSPTPQPPPGYNHPPGATSTSYIMVPALTMPILSGLGTLPPPPSEPSIITISVDMWISAVT